MDRQFTSMSLSSTFGGRRYLSPFLKVGSAAANQFHIPRYGAGAFLRNGNSRTFSSLSHSAPISSQGLCSYYAVSPGGERAANSYMCMQWAI